MAKVKRKKKRENLPAKVQDTQLPAFMQAEEETGVEELAQFIIPPRVKIVQAQSGGQLKELFEVGDVVLVPQMLLVAPFGEPFHFTPIFFFPEWLLTNPVGVTPFVRERSTDPQSEIAAKARNKVSIPCPEKPGKECRYVQHLNYISIIHNVDVSTPVVLSFARAEHSTGQNLASRIRMRKAPIYGCTFEAQVMERENAEGNWCGFDILNPSEESRVSPFIQDEEMFNELKAFHLEFKDAHEKSMIQLDFENDDKVEGFEDEEDTEY